uniref:Uncharacterized protein n=1 Tax=Amphimedon queenslandica TaxID=400682 RepID=A0A1X7UG47_AMPQE
MSTKPEELKRAFDRELNITDFQLVWEKAGRCSFGTLGLYCGEATTSPVHTSPSKEATPTVELPVPTSPQSESSVIYIKKKSIEYSPNNLTRMIGDL